MLPYNFLKRTKKALGGHGLTKKPIIGKIYKSISKKVVPEFIMFEGNKIYLDSVDAINFAMNDYNESFENSFFKTQIKPGDIVLDIGANIGIYSLTAAKLVGNSGTVFSFEPDEICFTNLKKNAEKNSLKNIILVKKAVSNYNGKAEFSKSVNELSRSTNHLIFNHNDNVESITIETISIDKFLKDKLKKINVVKIDVEGAEFEVFKGMKELIKINNDLKIFFEFNPSALSRLNTKIPEFIDFLFDLNLSCYNIEEKTETKKLVDREWLMKFALKNSTKGYTNLFCIKK